MEGLDSYCNADTLRVAIEADNTDVAETSQGVVGMTEVDRLEDALVM